MYTIIESRLMSFLPNEERPKLKAKRFNKFESSSAPKIAKEDFNSIEKRGLKRTGTGDEGNCLVKPKRICAGTNLYTSPLTKNLANNRLKKLKEQLHADLNSTNVEQIKANISEDKVIKQLNEKGSILTKLHSLDDETQNVSGKLAKRNILETNVKHKFDSAYKNISVTPLNPRSKTNLAQARLQKIKKNLSINDCYTKTSNVTNTNLSNHNLYDDCIKHKKTSTTEGSSSKISENIPGQRSCTLKESNIQCFSKSDANNFSCNNPVSETSKPNAKSTNYISEKNHSQTLETSTPESSSALQRLSDTENNLCVVNHKQCDSFKSCKQPVTQKLQHDINQESTSNLPIGGSNNFLSKMEMTASWIRNHQTSSNAFNSTIETGDNSINERIEHNADIIKFDDGPEDMEWTNAEPDDEVVDPNKYVDETSKKDEDDKKVIKDPEKCKDVCVIVDTNVFMSGLSKIRDILNLKITGSFKPIIFVPWMVISELDYMKDSCSNNKLSKNIANAIKFINTALNEKNPQVVGQTVFDVEKQKYIGSSPDDKIISCCLQAAEKYENVILLSNDMNLKNKAMINDITACSSNEIMIKLMSKLVKNTKAKKIMHKMGIMCSSIICDCMKTAYGDIWVKMDMMSYPPWSLVECLKRFKKYWTAVFSEKLLKQFTKTVQDLQYLLEINNCISDDSNEFVEFTKLCVTLCIFLKDIEECRGFTENMLADITKTA